MTFRECMQTLANEGNVRYRLNLFAGVFEFDPCDPQDYLNEQHPMEDTAEYYLKEDGIYEVGSETPAFIILR